MEKAEVIAAWVCSTLMFAAATTMVAICVQSSNAASLAQMTACVQSGGIYVDGRNPICIPRPLP